MSSLTRLAETWARVRPLDGQRRALIVLGVGLLLTVVAFFAVRSHEHERRHADFELRAADLTASLRTSFELPLETLRLMPSLFDGSDGVDREEFINLVGPPLARHPGVAYLEWAPEVLGEERESFEQHARELGFRDFFIGDPGPNGGLTPAPPRPRHLPLLFVAPDSPEVVGLDLTFEPLRRELALRALSESLLTVSPQFQMVEDPPDVRSIAVYAPLIKPRHPSADPRGPRRGLAILIFRIAPLVRAVLGDKLKTLDLVILDESAAGVAEVLFESTHGLAKQETSEHDASFSSPFEFHTRHWTMRFMAKPGSMEAGLLSPVIGSFGALLAIAAMLLVGMLDLALRLRGEVTAAKQVGQYRLVRKLGEGGMGIVYEAEHAMLRRPTAVKVISPRAVGQDAIERFEREVKATSQLTHPNTVAVYDYGRAPRGVFYYAMEYLPGANIEQIVRATGPMPPARVVHLLSQACASLAEAHAAGLVHRDIKPANLMVCERGGIHDFVKVLDFGLVKNQHQSENAHSVAGQIVGTPHYMAPEIVLSRGACPASDLYALGAVGYFMLTGTEVFLGSTLIGVVARHISDLPEPPSERLGSPLPAALEALILRCLNKAIEDRPSSAGELAALLQESGAGSWGQPEAKDFWARERVRVMATPSSDGPVRASRATPGIPWSDTLVVDMNDRGLPAPASDPLLESAERPAGRAAPSVEAEASPSVSGDVTTSVTDRVRDVADPPG